MHNDPPSTGLPSHDGPPKPVTTLLDAVAGGDAAAQERLWLLVYDELRHVARRQMGRERGRRTLQTTALINEAYLRLLGDGNVAWANRRHFFAAAANAMRQIRIDHARRRNAVKRGGGAARDQGIEGLREQGTEGSRDQAVGSEAGLRPDSPRAKRVSMDALADGPAIFDDDPAEVLAIDEALRKLESKVPLRAEVVKLRYFAGLNREEIAGAMGIAVQTVDKYWRLARAWLHRELSKE